MALKGDLASVDLAQVFQMLALNQKVGMLCIQSPRAWRALSFEPRGACLFYNEHIMLDRVLLQLCRTGRVDDLGVGEARDHAATQNIPLSEVLLAGGYPSEAELEQGLGVQLEEDIYDLFFWRDAHFEFFEGATTVAGREGVIDSRFFFSTDSLIMEAARRIDEWSYIQERVAGPLEIFLPAQSDANVIELEETALSLLDLIDGKRNIARLVEITGLSPFLVYKGLAQLLEEGMVVPVRDEDLTRTARECVQEGRHQDAINLYEKAIAVGQGIPDSHQQAAIVYENSQEFELAAYHHKCVAEFHAGAGEARRAVDILKHVVAILPTDLSARERLVELTVGRPELATKDFDPVANGKELVDLYLEIGEIERVRGVLERLLRDNPFDIELKKSLINVHTKAGDTKRVMELYESIAEDLVRDRKPIEAVKYLQKILMLDRNRKDVSERIRSLYVMDERRRTRRRSMIALTAMALILAALGAVYYLYDQHARERLGKIEGVVEKLVEAKDYVQARSLYEGFIRQYPLTLISREVDGELARIESLQRAAEAELERERRERRQESDKIRQAYRMAWTVFQSYVDNHELDRALEQIESIERMVAKAGEVEDRRWANDVVKLEDNRRKLSEYMSEALALDRQAWERFDAGDWSAARELWLELITKRGFSQTAQTVRLPVELRTRPAGAKVYQHGKPLLEQGDGIRPQKVTPCLVMCQPGTPELFELHREGFEPARLQIDARAAATAEVVLTVIPARQLRFEAAARGTVSTQSGYLGVGLRGGKVALIRVIDTGTVATVSLPGLDELDGAIAFTTESAIFVTKEGYLTSISLRDGSSLWGRRIQLSYPPVHDLIVNNGRVLFADSEGRLLAIDAHDGNNLWFTPLGGVTVGRPVVADRLLRIGLRGGEVVQVDASDGKIVRRIPTPSGVATSVRLVNGALILGLDDGRIVALREDTGALAWSHQLPDAASVVEIEIALESVLFVDSKHRLTKLGLRDGKVEGTLQLAGALLSGPRVSERRICVTVREHHQKGPDADLLQAVDFDELTVAWEYRDGGQFSGGLTTQGAEVFLPDSKGDVLHFR